ncbi:outer membrane homotrimeric porin [Desulfovibrio sp. 86]|uniref:Outer membrane homotrimeric porin n=1 Tax=uncultured Desulfovibrio sp. TaxID=167968 RepID=A0A212KXN8_9BACT|nr:outer membrane homotrimeric porin [Desulfovibrio sp. 86]SCM70027.1 conserved exported hypothetical protein [uncultured Desulfovibrio sp.]VZH35354.1 conserved exported protein of unknown function [Desulfovibrio sp. 86]
MNVKQRKGLQRFKKSCMVALLAAGLLMGAAGGAKAIDFKAQGEWLMGFSLSNTQLTEHTTTPEGKKTKANTDDDFSAAQRLRLQLDAVASEALSGTVYFEIGTQNWGKGDEGGALGADGNNVIKLKNAYIDWVIPQTDARMRMGIQALALPNMAGGSAVLDADVAAVVGNYKFNENVGLTAFWARPVNDNFNVKDYGNGDRKAKDNYLDNMDLFAVSLPMTFDGIEITPWAMYGMLGRNALRGLDRIDENSPTPWETSDGVLGLTIPGLTPGFNYADGTPLTSRTTGKQYGNMFWAGLPVGITMFDPLNIEFDINYGYVEEMGRFDVKKRGDDNDIVRGSSARQGFVVKALVEYKMDWATPGIFGWYGSGDDGNIKNGSERMPSIAGAGNFTSFIGDGNLSWGAGPGTINDWNMSYAGTWGIGGQLKDISFMEDLKHTLRVAYWGGTNAPSMVKYMAEASSWREGYGGDGPYLTTNDGLLEFNLINQWQIYENLEANLELGYVVNMMDKDTWKKDGYYSGGGNGNFDKRDACKAQLVFAYSF